MAEEQTFIVKKGQLIEYRCGYIRFLEDSRIRTSQELRVIPLPEPELLDKTKTQEKPSDESCPE